LLASASDDKMVKLWDMAMGAALQTLEGHTSWVNAVAFSPDGKPPASASGDEAVKLWDTGPALQTLKAILLNVGHHSMHTFCHSSFRLFGLHALRLRFSRASFALRGFCCFLCFLCSLAFSLFLNDLPSRRLSYEKTLVFLFFHFTGSLSSRDSRLKLLTALDFAYIGVPLALSRRYAGEPGAILAGRCALID
jgi:WD40 repeat protein